MRQILLDMSWLSLIYPILFTAMPCEVAESHMITVF